MVPSRIQQRTSDATSPRRWCHEQVVQNPNAPGRDRRERRIQLNKTDAVPKLRIDGNKNHRLVVREAIAEERFCETQVRRLTVELAVAVEQSGHDADVSQRSTANLEFQCV